MAKWFFEPGHTAAAFCARHMMVTYVRGHFKDIHGQLDFDPENPAALSLQAAIDAKGISSGGGERDEHLRDADFLDVENHPTITFASTGVEIVGDHDYRVTGDLTLRGVTRSVELKVRYLGQWPTAWWEDGVDKGPILRAGFVAEGAISRQDFGISWNAVMDRGGLVVGDTVEITIDAEAVQERP